MYVLSEMIKLPEFGDDLPLPWYQRACLGLITRTSCFVAIVESKVGQGRPVGDIIVSVLNPMEWGNMIRVQCSRDDAPGVVAQAFDVVGETNIALAESITTDEGSRHTVNLICELLGNSNLKRYLAAIRKRLKERGFEGITVEPYQNQQNVIWHDVGIVERGWVVDANWKYEVHRRYKQVAERCNIDLSKAVATVDTATRALRFVFPHKGARNISIEHADIPGALKTLTSTLLSCDVNLLSAILRRGGAKPGNAVLLATAEPKGGQNAGDLTGRIKGQIEQIPTKFRPVLRIHSGIDATKLIFPRDPDTLVAPCPNY